MSSIIINGEISDQININDRGLQYGDGLFETIAMKNNKLLMWHEHLSRLSQGCKVLGLSEIDEQQWLEIESVTRESDEKNKYRCRFVTLERK